MIYSVVGHYSLILGLCVALILIFFSIQNFKNSNQLDTKILSFSFLQLFFVLISFLALIFSFVISDFSNETVFNNSHTTKPLFYKISGTWGNHEGSLLLWLLVLTLFIFIFLLRTKNQPIKYKILTLGFQQVIIIGFFLFLIQTSNPFNYLFPVPDEGLGLNPILQDPALAIHPPILYLGYVGSSIIFSSALAATTLKMVSTSWAAHIKKWVLFAWIFLTLGILLGSIWAYYELGWGGFWFWDPVENASLLPWFAISALMHSVIVLEKRNVLYSWVIILCLLTFTLSVMGTFLVRSGILNSVHTFASDPTRGLYILLFLSIMIFFSLFLFFKNQKKEVFNFNLASKEFFILTNNWFMAFFLFTVFIGIVYPIFLDVLTQVKISIGPPFYNIIIIPLVIPFLFLMAIGPQAKWIKNHKKNILKFFILFFLSIFINFMIFFLFGSYSLLSNLIFISSIFLIIHSIEDLFQNIRKKTNFGYPRIISHLGFGMLVFFIGINHQFSIEENFNLKIGENKRFDKYEIYFEKLNMQEHENYKAIVGSFKILDIKNNLINFLNPEIRIYSNPETLTYEASIKTKAITDLYLTMSNISRSDYYNIRFQDKPFMIWIWISSLMIVLGGFLRLVSREKNAT